MTDLMVLTEEEVRYFLALLSWEPSDDDEDDDDEDEDVEDVQGRSRDPERPAGHLMFLVLGAKGCGKTSILERFCHGMSAKEPEEDKSFDPDDQERGYRHSMRIEDQTYIFNALELPPQHLSDEERLKQAVQITEAAILVYDVRSRASFSLVSEIHNRIYDMIDNRERAYGFVLIGSNSDCEDEERKVSWTEGYKLAGGFKLKCAFAETSAKTGENIDKVFTQLAKEVLKLRWLNHQQREQVERVSDDVQQYSIEVSLSKRVAMWRSWARPWFQRRAGERKTSAPY